MLFAPRPPLARASLFVSASMLLLAACTKDYTLTRQSDVGAEPYDFASKLTFDEGGRMLLAFPNLGWKAFQGGAWQSVDVPAGICMTRETEAEGSIALTETTLYQWSDGAYRAAGPTQGCHPEIALAGNGDVFSHRYLNDVGGKAVTEIRRGKPDGTWTVAFPGQVELGFPTGVLAERKGNVWIVGRQGIARVSADGETFTVVADCSHPFYEGCLGFGSRQIFSSNPVVGRDDDLYFRRSWTTGAEISLPELYRVRAKDLTIEPLVDIPLNIMPESDWDEPVEITQLNSYDIDRDGNLWAVLGANSTRDAPHYLFKGQPGGSLEKVLPLDSNGYQVTASNKGEIFVYEVGMQNAKGIFKLE